MAASEHHTLTLLANLHSQVKPILGDRTQRHLSDTHTAAGVARHAFGERCACGDGDLKRLGEHDLLELFQGLGVAGVAASMPVIKGAGRHPYAPRGTFDRLPGLDPGEARGELGLALLAGLR